MHFTHFLYAKRNSKPCRPAIVRIYRRHLKRQANYIITARFLQGCFATKCFATKSVLLMPPPVQYRIVTQRSGCDSERTHDGAGEERSLRRAKLSEVRADEAEGCSDDLTHPYFLYKMFLAF
jgi:hypothetical protein